MSTQPQSHISSDVVEEPPNASASWHTIADQRWKLARFTSPEWAVDVCRYQDNDHAGVRCTTLRATLEHATGARVLCKPIDPWQHQPGQTIYRKHRVIVRKSMYDDDLVVTLETENVPDTAASVLREHDGDPFSGAVDRLQTTPYPEVKQTDEFVTDNAQQYGRGTAVDSIDGALWATIGAARRFSTQYKRNRQWFFQNDG